MEILKFALSVPVTGRRIDKALRIGLLVALFYASPYSRSVDTKKKVNIIRGQDFRLDGQIIRSNCNRQFIRLYSSSSELALR